MTNNDILRRLRYVFDFNDAKMIEIFALADVDVRRGHIVAWLVKDDVSHCGKDNGESQYFVKINKILMVK